MHFGKVGARFRVGMNETVTEQPELSIVIAALGPYETVRNAIKQLERAKVKDRL
jgi:hypothetical protein